VFVFDTGSAGFGGTFEVRMIVCVKPTPDVNVVCLDPFEENRIDPDDLVYEANPSDVVAVEEAVRIKEKNPLAEVVVLSMAPPSTISVLRSCLAMGCDEGVLLWDDDFRDSDSYATGVILAKAIGLGKFDLILCGSGAADTAQGQVGYVIADLLHVPILSKVNELRIHPEDHKITVERKIEKGRRQGVEVPLPALLCVEESMNEPRYASLPSLIGALRKDIGIHNRKSLGLSPQEVGVRGSKTKIVQLSLPRPRPKKLFTPDSSLSAAERMRLVMSGGAKQRREELFEGSPDELSRKLIQYLTQMRVFEPREDEREPSNDQ